MKMHAACLAALAIIAAATPAMAQSDDMNPARLQQLDQKAAAMKLSTNHAKAISVAKSKGMASVDEIRLTTRGNWQIEGLDSQGHKIKVRIDGKTAKLEKLERK
jgi:Peptidase propeptide and YPEB domain